MLEDKELGRGAEDPEKSSGDGGREIQDGGPQKGMLDPRVKRIPEKEPVLAQKQAPPPEPAPEPIKKRRLQGFLNPEGMTSKFKWVSWDAERKAWQAKVCVNGKMVHAGRYFDEIDAALAADKLVRKVRKNCFDMNFTSPDTNGPYYEHPRFEMVDNESDAKTHIEGQDLMSFGLEGEGEE